jgi:hypothetical protein
MQWVINKGTVPCQECGAPSLYSFGNDDHMHHYCAIHFARFCMVNIFVVVMKMTPEEAETEGEWATQILGEQIFSNTIRVN